MSISTPGCSGFHTGLINEDRCHWRMGLQGRKKNHFRCSATVPILHRLHVYLISISAGCNGWTHALSWNLSGKVSLRSPTLFFLIKLIRQSATGARLTAARDRWSTYSNPQAVILQNCSEMWATWVFTTTQGCRDVAGFSAIINQAVLQVHFFLFFSFPVAFEPFISGCSSWSD